VKKWKIVMSPRGGGFLLTHTVYWYDAGSNIVALWIRVNERWSPVACRECGLLQTSSACRMSSHLYAIYRCSVNSINPSRLTKFLQALKLTGGRGKNYPQCSSAHRCDSSEIPTAIHTFSGSSIPKKRVTMLSDITGSRKSNMAADKPEISNLSTYWCNRFTFEKIHWFSVKMLETNNDNSARQMFHIWNTNRK